ncbi:MAG: ZIP family metal transporter [Gemmatimonadetes bacterium]|nr:ZIP family metal transporter [Gemmatimonadota bacterium]
MDSNFLILLLGYALAILSASLLGGYLPTIVAMTHTRIQMVMSFVAGFILGVALYHLLPHGLVMIPEPGAVEKAAGLMMFGIILMVLLLRIFHFHQHEFGDEAGDFHHEHAHDHASPESRLIGVCLGLGLHTMTEGVALGTSIRVGEIHGDEAGLAGLGVFLAILLHKPLDAFSIIGLLQAAGHSLRTRIAVNIGFAMLCPVVALLTFWGIGFLGHWEEEVVGYVLVLAAGAFLCISLSDLLPEIHFHSHDRVKLTVCFLMGIVLAYGLYFIESGAVHGLETHEMH